MARIQKTDIFLALGVFTAAMAFAVYTQHAWEDWYIAFKTSRNLATGHGPVYMPGERYHTFSSVIGMLIPALLSFVTLGHSDDLVLWLFRILNAGLLALGAVLLARSAGRWFLGFAGLPVAVFLIGAFALDAKTLDFTINGMETPYVLLALILFLYFLTFHPVEKLGVRLGAVWALLQYARPDGFIFAILLMAGMLLFLRERRAALKALAVSVFVGALLFAPWFLFSLWYYGTPVPHSLVAKGALRSFAPDEILAKTWGSLQSFLLLRPSVLDGVFTPPYAPFFGIMPPTLVVSRCLGLAASVVWLFPGVAPAGRIASLAFLGFLLYLAVFTPFVYPWYIPGATLLGLVALAFGFHALLRRLRAALPPPSAAPARIGWAAGGVLPVFTLALTLISAHQFRLMQEIIERNHRQKIGEWLRANSKSDRETVFLECVGYVGFYSGLKMYDHPGMTSPEMVHARRTLQTDRTGRLVRHLRPDWLVMRPGEINGGPEDHFFVVNNYEQAMIFDANREIDQIAFKPFEKYFRFDASFLLARKKAPAAWPGSLP